MAVTEIHPITTTLSKALDYIQNPDKTDEKMLVSGYACSPLLEGVDQAGGAARTARRIAEILLEQLPAGEQDTVVNASISYNFV